MTVIVARHGRTAWNAEGRFQGMGDPPLDEVGERQAAILAAELSPFQPRWVASSDLQRARRTAAVVAAACRVEPTTDPALREVDLGTWEGLTQQEVEARFPDEYQRWRCGEDVRRGGGETRAEAAARCVAAMVGLAAGSPAGALGVVVGHGIVLQSAMDLLAGKGLLAAPDLSAGAPHLANGAWLALELAPAAG